MAKNTFTTIAILTVLLLSLTVVSAEYTTTANNVTLTTYVNALTDVSEGETYDFDATIENLNNTNFYVVFGTTGWEWDGDEITIINGTSEEFEGTMTIPESANTKSIIAKFYDASNNSEFLFQLSKSVSLSYLNDTEDPENNETDEEPTIVTFCSDGNHGYLEIVEFDVVNNGKGDDNEWEYLDEIEIEVTVENTGNDNINDVLVEIKITDEDNNIISRRKINLDKDEIDLGRINDDDEETAIFKIDEVPIDLENGDYRIYVKAYDENNEDTECTSTSEDFTDDDDQYFKFEIVQNDGATVIVKEDIENVQASCGDKNVEVKFMVYNTGDNDEEKVLVMLENSKLGIKEKLIIDNLRDKKGKEATFYITIPDNIDKSYVELDIYTYYDYDEDEDELDELIAYGESSESESDDFSIGLEILSCQKISDVTIQIDLESETIVGEQIIIKATLTNNGEDNDFVISTSELESWAKSITVSPLTVSIAEGKSAEIIITFIPLTAGEHTFKINAGQDASQSAIINIKEKPSIFSDISNTMLYTIVGIAVVLILIFLVLIIKVSRRQDKPQF